MSQSRRVSKCSPPADAKRASNGSVPGGSYISRCRIHRKVRSADGKISASDIYAGLGVNIAGNGYLSAVSDHKTIRSVVLELNNISRALLIDQ